MTMTLSPSLIRRCTASARVTRPFITRRPSSTSQDILSDLLSKFRDPSSHYYTPPGEPGPDSPHDHSSSRQPQKGESRSERPGIDGLAERSSRDSAQQYFRDNGYDHRGQLEWPVAWGDCDMFQHANNVQFVRWFESARLEYAESLRGEIPDEQVDRGECLALEARGKGIGIILKDVSVRYRLPVTYPDKLIIATRLHSMQQERSSFGMAGGFWSLKLGKLVAEADSTIVCYDYNNLKKGKMTDALRDALAFRQTSSGMGTT